MTTVFVLAERSPESQGLARLLATLSFGFFPLKLWILLDQELGLTFFFFFFFFAFLFFCLCNCLTKSQVVMAPGKEERSILAELQGLETAEPFAKRVPGHREIDVV